jgi:hypothetical protein
LGCELFCLPADRNPGLNELSGLLDDQIPGKLHILAFIPANPFETRVLLVQHLSGFSGCVSFSSSIGDLPGTWATALEPVRQRLCHSTSHNTSEN